MLPVQMQGWNRGRSDRPSERQIRQMSAPPPSGSIILTMCDLRIIFKHYFNIKFIRLFNIKYKRINILNRQLNK